MKYIIMCGGSYEKFETPKHLSVVNGERLVDRTIRLLKENGIKDIYISSNNPVFDSCGVPRLEHKNDYVLKIGDGNTGYWLDAYYPMDEPVVYLNGDVYYSQNAIKTIIETPTDDILFFASTIPCRPDYFKQWEEPMGYKVMNQARFKKGIEICKHKKDLGYTNREPVAWELYRVLNGIDINTHIIGDNFIPINDESTDIDSPQDIIELEKIIKKFNLK